MENAEKQLECASDVSTSTRRPPEPILDKRNSPKEPKPTSVLTAEMSERGGTMEHTLAKDTV
jgi:hypothetical protein